MNSNRVYTLYKDMIEQPHLLIAGATGSGKSTLENGLIHTLLVLHPETNLLLIDPKRTELVDYKYLPQCVGYADDMEEAYRLLQAMQSTIDRRNRAMQRKRLKKTDLPHIYIFIDECADLFLNVPKAKKEVQHIAQVGRAAGVHVVLCTQTPIAKVLPTEIKCNFDARVALRTRSRQDSRNILDMAGAETLPRYGEGIYMTAQEYTRYELPIYENEEVNKVVERFYQASQPKGIFRLFQR